MSQTEVWCHACNVTFPPQTKQCMHCGGRTRPDTPRRPMRGVLDERTSSFGAAPISYTDEREAPPVDFDPRLSDEAVEPEEEPARRSFLRAGMTFVWMVLLAAGYAWRACSQ